MSKAEQELNKKLAEWVGWTIEGDDVVIIHTEYPPNQTCQGYEAEYLCRVDQLNFTQSLDACFKWLVPMFNWVYIQRFDPSHTGDRKEHSYASILDGGKYYRGEAETPALALCRAIEKLIDEQSQS